MISLLDSIMARSRPTSVVIRPSRPMPQLLEVSPIKVIATKWPVPTYLLELIRLLLRPTRGLPQHLPSRPVLLGTGPNLGVACRRSVHASNRAHLTSLPHSFRDLEYPPCRMQRASGSPVRKWVWTPVMDLYLKEWCFNSQASQRPCTLTARVRRILSYAKGKLASFNLSPRHLWSEVIIVTYRGANTHCNGNSIVALLDLADEHLQCTGLVIALERTSPALGDLLHSLMYVGGAVVTKPPFPVDESFVLVGIEI